MQKYFIKDDQICSGTEEKHEVLSRVGIVFSIWREKTNEKVHAEIHKHGNANVVSDWYLDRIAELRKNKKMLESDRMRYISSDKFDIDKLNEIVENAESLTQFYTDMLKEKTNAEQIAQNSKN